MAETGFRNSCLYQPHSLPGHARARLLSPNPLAFFFLFQRRVQCRVLETSSRNNALRNLPMEANLMWIVAAAVVEAPFTEGMSSVQGQVRSISNSGERFIYDRWSPIAYRYLAKSSPIHAKLQPRPLMPEDPKAMRLSRLCKPWRGSM